MDTGSQESSAAQLFHIVEKELSSAAGGKATENKLSPLDSKQCKETLKFASENGVQPDIPSSESCSDQVAINSESPEQFAECEESTSAQTMHIITGSCKATSTASPVNPQTMLQPSVAVLSVEDGTVTVRSSAPKLEPDCAYNLAESQLVAMESTDASALVGPYIVQDASEEGSGNEHDGCSFSTTSNSRWPHQETLRLIQLYKENQHYFMNKHYKKKTVWAMIAAKLAKGSRLKMKFTSEQVYNRWKNLTKVYRDCRTQMEQTGSRTGKCRYFDELSFVYDANSSAGSKQSKRACVKCRLRKHLNTDQSKLPLPAQNFVAIAPKTAIHPESMASSASLKSIMFGENLVSAGSHTSDGRDFLELVQAVQKLREDQRKSEEWKLSRLEQMHKERMQMFSQMLGILTDLKS